MLAAAVSSLRATGRRRFRLRPDAGEQQGEAHDDREEGDVLGEEAGVQRGAEGRLVDPEVAKTILNFAAGLVRYAFDRLLLLG
ncbi:MAG: hypothetical protein JWN65_295 [Solirubrobacterales bacterium]|nr:hypothetical protein [Solirubrobacterales bacterium]